MHKLVTLIMYLLWTVTILATLAATFYDFKYEDLNVIAGVFFCFSVINTYFVLNFKRKQ